MSRYVIRALDSDVDSKKFDCDEPLLNEYLRRYAGQDVKRGVARVFIATPDEAPTQIAGFFTLSAASVQCEALPEHWRKKLPRYPAPVALLGRLAVDQKFHGKGIGSILLADACRKVNAASQTLAVVGIIVDAKSVAAASFYRHFGFIDLPGQGQRMILPRGRFAE